MKSVAFFLIAVATVAGVFVLTSPASGQGEAVPIFGIKMHDGKRSAGAKACRGFDRIIQCHRNAGRAGVTPSLHDSVAFLEWHVAPLGRYRDGRLADLREEQLIHIVCGELVLRGQFSSLTDAG